MSRAREMVTFDAVSKKYGGLLALDRVSFAIDGGDIFGYIGPNGAGKTTTIKILVGLVSDFRGSLDIDGQRMPENRVRVSRMLGYLPQGVAFQEWRTVDEVLLTFGRLSGLSRKEIEIRSRELLGLFGLSKERHKRVVHLSGGMIQKLGLVQALLHSPKLLVLDEPLAGLDPESRIQIKSTLRDLGRNGTTIFFSSHILSDVQDIATKIGIISNGKIMKIGTLEELKSHFSVVSDIDVELSHNSGQYRELSSLEGIAGLEQPELNRMVIHLDGKRDLDETIHDVIKTLIKMGCRIRSIKPKTPGLDEVYLQYLKRGEGP
jgi:ABC-2 type transport system ATP-binding protein